MPIPVAPTALSSLGNSLRSTDNGFLKVDIIIMTVWMKKKLTVDTEKAHYMLAVQTFSQKNMNYTTHFNHNNCFCPAPSPTEKTLATRTVEFSCRQEAVSVFSLAGQH